MTLSAHLILFHELAKPGEARPGLLLSTKNAREPQKWFSVIFRAASHKLRSHFCRCTTEADSVESSFL